MSGCAMSRHNQFRSIQETLQDSWSIQISDWDVLREVAINNALDALNSRIYFFHLSTNIPKVGWRRFFSCLRC